MYITTQKDKTHQPEYVVRVRSRQLFAPEMKYILQTKYPTPNVAHIPANPEKRVAISTLYVNRFGVGPFRLRLSFSYNSWPVTKTTRPATFVRLPKDQQNMPVSQPKRSDAVLKVAPATTCRVCCQSLASGRAFARFRVFDRDNTRLSHVYMSCDTKGFGTAKCAMAVIRLLLHAARQSYKWLCAVRTRVKTHTHTIFKNNKQLSILPLLGSRRYKERVYDYRFSMNSSDRHAQTTRAPQTSDRTKIPTILCCCSL